ncbi:MAG: hypothetical protein AAB368_14225, partial [bacterium]
VPATLSVSVYTIPTTVSVGQTIYVGVSVTNTGSTTATALVCSVPQLAGGGSVAFLGGPWPWSSTMLSPGKTDTVYWVFWAAAPGPVSFTVTLAGTEALRGWPVTSGPVTSGTALIQTPPALTIAAFTVSPSGVCQGELVTLELTVSNSGEAGIVGLDLSSLFECSACTAQASSTPLSVDPPPPWVGIPGGGSQTISIVTEVTGTGFIQLSGTVTGYDANFLAVYQLNQVASPPAASNSVTVYAGALLTAQVLTTGPAVVGQVVTVALTVTNIGSGPAGNVLPSLTATGAGAVALLTGPVPVGVPSLAAGASETFVWTLSATAAGAVAWSASVTALSCSGTTLQSSVTASSVYNAPGLTVTVTVPPGAVTGEIFAVVLTVSNTGGITVNGVLPDATASDPGGVLSLVSGPTPAGPVDLAPGASQTFTYTVSSSGAGTFDFTGTGTGTDDVFASPLLASDTASLVITQAAQLVATLTASGTLFFPGEQFLLVGQVTNTGGSTADDVRPRLWKSSGTGSGVFAGPTPAPGVSLAAAGVMTFTWTVTAGTPGTIQWSYTVSADGPAYSPLALSQTVTIQVPASLAAAVATSVTAACASANFLVMVTVTNTGGASAGALVIPDPVAGGSGGAVKVAGPSPAVPPALVPALRTRLPPLPVPPVLLLAATVRFAAATPSATASTATSRVRAAPEAKVTLPVTRRLTALAAPSAGVTSVGDVARTTLPEPVTAFPSRVTVPAESGKVYARSAVRSAVVTVPVNLPAPPACGTTAIWSSV